MKDDNEIIQAKDLGDLDDPIVESLRGDNRRKQLEAMRDLIIADFVSGKNLGGSDRASLYKRLQDVLEAIEQLGSIDNPTAEKVEEIQNRRKTGQKSNVVEFEFGKHTKRPMIGEKRSGTK